MKIFQDTYNSLHAAGIDTSRFLSARLRSETRASGWPEEVTRHMAVSYRDGFQVKSHPSHKDQVHNLEYGTPGVLPTAAIRRFSNRTKEAETFLLGRFSQHMRGTR